MPWPTLPHPPRWSSLSCSHRFQPHYHGRLFLIHSWAVKAMELSNFLLRHQEQEQEQKHRTCVLAATYLLNLEAGLAVLASAGSQFFFFYRSPAVSRSTH